MRRIFVVSDTHTSTTPTFWHLHATMGRDFETSLM